MPTKADRSRSLQGLWGTYAEGPSACAPHPKVIKNIKKQIAKARILSVADARIAALSGLLGTPLENRSGFNDGVIYPPEAEDLTAGLARSRGRTKPRVSRALAFLMACTANLGIVMLKNTSAPLFFRLTIWESTVGSVTS